jgi:predicted ribosome quality control (RQC) complex YloA/Tae2 family protein
VTVPDPRGGPEIRVELKRGLGVARTADALFKRARALEGRRSAFEDRLAGVERDIAAARTELARLASVERLEDAPSAPPARDGAAADSAAPWRFITSRGLPVWVGRTAAENHELTFAKARPEDVWLHVLDAPGAHVILRNLDGRATPADIAEAAAVAAWHSARRGEAAVDVQHCARKHVHPAPGGKGRVIAGHREVVRVAPRDPRGWLRRR